VNIEFDPAKAKCNLRKHRVSFEEAVTVIFDPMALCIEDSTAEGESRWVLVGMSDLGRLLTVVYTLRKERIRIISARKSTRRETKDYA
jgi:uncharacterized DUF497 family protein